MAIGWSSRRLQQLQAVPVESAVAKAIAERIGRSATLLMKSAVAVPKVVAHPLGTRFKQRQLIGISGHGKRQTATGRPPPQQHISKGRSALLPGIPEQEQGRHRRLPGLREDRATAHQHHHRARIGGGHLPDQRHLIGGQLQIGAVAGGKVAAGPGSAVAGDPGDRTGHRPPAGQDQPPTKQLQ